MEGHIVTFYSYKGGTGRTMALANVAWILASNGLQVLTIDWDLESPGLHEYFAPFQLEWTIRETPGIVDIVVHYALDAVTQRQRSDDWLLEHAHITTHAVSLDWEHFPDGGTLDFISAGRQNRDYALVQASIDWDNLYSRLGGGQFFDALRVDLKQSYDYVLIDSRTGLSDIADICAIQLPDTLVDCFTFNDQSIEGASAVASHVARNYHERNIRILPVPMRIEESMLEHVEVGRALARKKFTGFPAGVTPEIARQYWRSVEIPYKPFYAFEEILAALVDQPKVPTSLLAAFERLTAVITDGQVRSMPSLPEEARLHYLQRATIHRSILAEDREFLG